MLLCAAVTLLIPETNGKNLDEIESDVLFGKVQSATEISVASDELTDSSDYKNGAQREVKSEEVV